MKKITTVNINRQLSFIIILWVFVCHFALLAEDNWPMYMHDNSRSGTTDASLNFPMKLEWKYSSDHPKSSWSEIKKIDYYHGYYDLTPAITFDRVFHTIIFNKKVLFSSSVDNCVYCLDLKSGAIIWKFITNGPVRLAPCYLKKKVFFGSDDGYLYCVNPETGKEIWKYWAGGDVKRYLPGNERMISRWPIRAGIVSDEKNLYFTAGLFPNDKVFICSVDILTGKENYKKTLSSSAQGYMAINNSFLYIPTGRGMQMIVDAKNGRQSWKKLSQGDVVSVFNEFIFSGRSERGNSALYSSKTNNKVASLPAARRAIVFKNDIFFIQYGAICLVDKKTFINNTKIIDKLSGKNFKRTKEQIVDVRNAKLAIKNSYKWITRAPGVSSFILTKNAVIVGCRNKILALSRKTGEEIWQYKTKGTIDGLTAVNGCLIASSDSGGIYSFVSISHKKSIKNNVLAKKKVFNKKYDKSLLCGWFFSENSVKKAAIIGNKNILIPKSIITSNAINIQPLICNGKKQKTLISYRQNMDMFPSKSFTVEACILINKKTEKRGELLKSFYGNEGWMLGYDKEHFLFALKSKDGDGKCTFLKSKEKYKLNSWYNVVGVYDGKVMTLYVNGKKSGTSTAQSGEIAYFRKFQNMRIHNVFGEILELCLYNSALKPSEINSNFESIKPFLAKINSKKVTPDNEPLVSFFKNSSSCCISFQHGISNNSMLVYGKNKKNLDKKVSLNSNIVYLNKLQPDTKYYYQLMVDKKITGPIYQFSTSPNQFKQNKYFGKNKKIGQIAKKLLKKSGHNKGYCYIYNFDKGDLAYEIAKLSDLNIIGIEKDPVKLAKARQKFAKLGLYGTRINIYNSADKIQFQSKTGNLITSGSSFITGKLPEESIEFLYKMTRPNGGMIIFITDSKVKNSPKNPQKTSSKWKKQKAGKFNIYSISKNKLKNSGEWTHQYSGPGATACSNDKIVNENLEIQWFGAPGPERMADRHHRQMPPLFANGYLYILGDDYIYGVDAYNGAPLWEHIIPKSRRLGVMYDTGIMTADNDRVYVVSNDKCIGIEAKSGKVEKVYKVPYEKEEWGYISVTGNELVGSGQSLNSSWNSLERLNHLIYGDNKDLACSRNLFCYNIESEKLNWKYKNGVIINPTIVQGNGTIFFVKVPGITNSKGRFKLKELFEKNNAELVCLDTKTGKKKWKTKFMSKFRNIIFLNYTDNMLLASGSYNEGKNVKYSVIAYDAKTGRQMWESDSSLKDAKIGGGHGEQWQHPTIIKEMLFLQNHVINIKTGKKVEGVYGWARGKSGKGVSRNGCGTSSASENYLFFRNSFPIQMNYKTGERRATSKVLRPGCWINMIPAGGMLLIPESGSGCTCNSYTIQTSISFVPKEE